MKNIINWKCPECYRIDETDEDVIMNICPCCQCEMMLFNKKSVPTYNLIKIAQGSDGGMEVFKLVEERK